MANESSWVEQIYTHFLSRDFAYLFAGGLFICIFEYALWTEIVWLPQQLSLELFGFLSVSYFLGLLLHFIGDKIGLYLKIYTPHHDFAGSLTFDQKLIENYDSKILAHFERAFFQYIAGNSIGFSSILGGIFMVLLALYRRILNTVIPSINYIGLIFIFVISGICMLYLATTFYKEILKQEIQFKEDIELKMKNKIKKSTEATTME